MSQLDNKVSAGETQGKQAWERTLREFYLVAPEVDPLAVSPGVLLPSVARPLSDPERRWGTSPLVVFDEQTASENDLSAIPLLQLLRETLERLEEVEGRPSPLRDLAPGFVAAADESLEQRGPRQPLRELLDGASESFVQTLDPERRAAVRDELARIRAALPEGGAVYRLTEQALVLIHASILGQEHQQARRAFAERLRPLIEQVTNLLRAEALAVAGTQAPEMSQQLGHVGAEFVDVARLSSLLPEHRGSLRLTEQRHRRVAQAAQVMRRYLAELPNATGTVIVHDDQLPSLPLPSDARLVVDPEPCGRAASLFDELAGRMTEVLRAVRLAQLEIAGSYDPEYHDRALARFGPDAFSPSELQLIPTVVVVESVERLLAHDLSAFSRLLRSGRPVQILLSQAPFAARHPARLAEHQVSPAYLAVGHREAFAMQSTLAEPEHLIGGLRRMVSAARPSVAVVAVEDPTSRVPPWLQLAAAHAARAIPCFVYDPRAGSSWADRFDLAGNPQPDRPWPTFETEPSGEGSGNGKRMETFTFAHALALEPDCRRHLKAVPREMWSDEQLDLAEFLEDGNAATNRALPYLSISAEDGEAERAIVSRELTLATLDRMRAWHTYQELAGIENQYALRAAESARDEALADANQRVQGLQSEQAIQIEQARGDAARGAMERLVNVLLDLEPGTPLPQESAPVSPAPQAGPASEAVETTAAPQAESGATTAPAGAPYIDTMLCTTCNECTQLNPRMFKYDDNKQAFIADSKAGTFVELVKAAEKCPARCIHPGAPRTGDKTASKALVARAAKFN